MARKFRGNVVTPLNTLGHTIELSEINPLAHTTIFGNDDARPSTLLKAMIEYDTNNGRKTITVCFNSSYGALPGGTVVVDLTRANKAFILDPRKADLLAALVVASPHSFAIDVGGLEPGPAARIIERIAAELATRRSLVAPTTFAIDLIDVATPRRRMGLDADAVQQLNALLGRGYEIGVRVLMCGNAPTEYPLEFERGTVQSIVTRVTRNAIQSVGRHVNQEQQLVKAAMIPETGLASIPQYDFWFFPMTDDPFGPYLIELSDDAAAQGDDSDERAPNAQTAAFTAEYVETARKYDEERENAEIEQAVAAELQKRRIKQAVADRVSAVSLEHPRRTRQAAAPGVRVKAAAVATTAMRPSTKQVEDMLRIAGVTRPNCRARTVLNDAQMRGVAMTLTEAVVAGTTDLALTASAFGESIYIAGMMSKGIASALAYRYLQQRADQVESFRKRLLESDVTDAVGVVGARLRNVSAKRMPLDAEGRVKAVAKAWRDHLSSLTAPRPPHPANDVGGANAKAA